jgi:uncharacterized membrane protein
VNDSKTGSTYYLIPLKQSLIILFILLLIYLIILLIQFESNFISWIILIAIALICFIIILFLNVGTTIKYYRKYFHFRIESHNKGKIISIKQIKNDEDNLSLLQNKKKNHN